MGERLNGFALKLVFCAIITISILTLTVPAAAIVYVNDIYPTSPLIALENNTYGVQLYNYNWYSTYFYLDRYVDGYFEAEFGPYLINGESWLYFNDTMWGGQSAGNHSIIFCSYVSGSYYDDCLEEIWGWFGEPDLELSAISVASLDAYQDTTITATITNLGNADVGAFCIDLYVDNYTPRRSCGHSLPAGWWLNLSFDLDGEIFSPGEHRITFVADSSGLVSESDETNNDLFADFTWVGTHDLRLTDIYTHNPLEALQDITITAEIDNLGNAATGPFDVDMLIDGAHVLRHRIDDVQSGYYIDVDFLLDGGLTAGAHSIKFTADPTNIVDETNEGNNSRTETLTFTGKPDLEVSAIYSYDPLIALQPMTVSAGISNSGNKNAGAFWVDMYIDGARIVHQQVDGLQARDIYYIDLETDGLTAGTHEIKCVADSSSNVAESNEGNNQLIENWTWTGTPDLSVHTIYTPVPLNALENTIFEATISNFGNANAGPFYVALDVDGVNRHSWHFPSGLQARTNAHVSVTLSGQYFPEGSHAIRLRVDSSNQVGELYENNNSLTSSFAWSGLPDLTVADITASSPLVGGTNAVITATISNVGNAAAAPFFVAVTIQGVDNGSWHFPAGLPAQSSDVVSLTLPGGLIAGTYTIEFMADSEPVVAESDENNNSKKRDFTWTGTADLVVVDIWEQGLLVAGVESIIVAQISNLGYADSGPFQVAVYIDDADLGVWPIPNVPAGQSVVLPITLTGGLSAGEHRITFEADAWFDVPETDENHNERTEPFIWEEARPDLEVTDIYDPTSRAVKEDTVITALIFNNGYSDAGAFDLKMSIDNQQYVTVHFDGLQVRRGLEVPISVPGSYFPTPKNYSIAFKIDTGRIDDEMSKENNDRTESWQWIVPECTPEVGEGTGTVGRYRSHLDTCYYSGNSQYYLYDVSRRRDQTGHSHNGQMQPYAAIQTRCWVNGLMVDSNNLWDDPTQLAGVEAHFNAARVYDYMKASPFERNSYDDQGSSMVTIVNDPYLPNYSYWDENREEVQFNLIPLSGALDIVAHEWAHGITNSASGLIHAGQSGALSEAFSDWMGTAVEHKYEVGNWIMGNSILDVSLCNDLSNPPAYTSTCGNQELPQPDHMDNFITCSGDGGGVHFNMGIPNKMFYLLSASGEHGSPQPGAKKIKVQGIGIENAFKIAYLANIKYWSPNTAFSKAREEMVKAANDLFGQNEVNQVLNAWAAVGVGALPLITTSSSPSSGGTTSGGGEHEWGSSATIEAIPNPGCTFVSWTENGNVVSSSASYTFAVTGSHNFTANFASPKIFVTPASKDYGNVAVGKNSAAVTFSVQNIGNAALDVGAITLSGPNAPEFGLSANNCANMSLTDGQSCTIQAVFSPTSAGPKNATLSISSNDPDMSNFEVQLTGIGVVGQFSISGTITTGSGKISAPLSGATVTLAGAANTTTITNSSGNYSFAGLLNGSYTITPAMTGYSFSPVNKNVTVNGISITGQNFTATQGATYSISGSVTTGSGSPLSGVTLTLSGSAAGSTTTNSSGAFTFSGLSNGSYVVTPSMTGYSFSPTNRNVAVSGANVTSQNFTATQAVTYSISGTVTAATGSPLTGVTLTLSGAASSTTTTNSSGNYSFTGLANGSYTLTPSMTGYSFNPANRNVTVSGANVTSQNFTATQTSTYSIAGTITTSSGSPVAGVALTLTGASGGSATTNSSGYYSFTGLANGSYTITPSMTGYSFTPFNRSVTISSVDVTGQNFTATQGATYSISGNITTLSGKTTTPLPGVTVSLAGAANVTATTNSLGNYSFAGLPNGNYTVTPNMSGYSFSPANMNVVINGANVTGKNFTATSVFSISGTITKNDGGFLAGATVTLAGAATGTATTVSAGNYSFTVLLNGNYAVTPSMAGYAFAPGYRSISINNANVAAQNFTASTAYSISGTITKSNGSPLAGVTLSLSGAANGATTTDSAGNYSFSAPSGSYTITPSMTGYAFSPINRSVNINGANVTAQNFTAVTVYSISGVVTKNGNPLAGVTVTLTGAANATTTTDSAGNYLFTGLSNGNYTVTPTMSGNTFSPSNSMVTITGGSVSGVNFSANTYSISGTVIACGSGTPGVTMTLSGAASLTVTTAANGNYSFTGLLNGSYTVTPSLSDSTFSPTNRAITIYGTNVTGQNFTRVAVCL